MASNSSPAKLGAVLLKSSPQRMAILQNNDFVPNDSISEITAAIG
jgi:hypothetical protein